MTFSPRSQLHIEFFSTTALVGILSIAGCTNGGPGSESVGNRHDAVSTSDTLRHDENPVFWTGTVDASLPPPADHPDVCTQAKCARFDLTIDVPEETFEERAGGILVGIRWGEDDDALSLYVYQDGVQVAISTSFVANISQSVILPNVTSGTFNVYVALDVADSSDTVAAFDAVADIQHFPKVKPVRQLLPNLTVRSQTNIQFVQPSFPPFGPDPPPHATCFTTQQVLDGSKTCLRFD